MNTTLHRGLYRDASDNSEKIHGSEPSYLTLIVLFMAAQFIALVTLNIAAFQTLKKISTMPMEPNIQEVKPRG
jgi:hypothetical protein